MKRININRVIMGKNGMGIEPLIIDNKTTKYTRLHLRRPITSALIIRDRLRTSLKGNLNIIKPS